MTMKTCLMMSQTTASQPDAQETLMGRAASLFLVWSYLWLAFNFHIHNGIFGSFTQTIHSIS